MPDLSTILSVLAIIVVVGGALAFLLRKSVVETSQKILRETNADLLQRLEVVEKLGDDCKAELAASQERYQALRDVVTNTSAIADLAKQISEWQVDTMKALSTIQVGTAKIEVETKGAAARKT